MDNRQQITACKAATDDKRVCAYGPVAQLATADKTCCCMVVMGGGDRGIRQTRLTVAPGFGQRDAAVRLGNPSSSWSRG